MSNDEDTLIQRFKRVFWEEYISIFQSELIDRELRVDQRSAAGVISKLKGLLADADAASVLISSNEEIEDVPTSSLLFTWLLYALGHCIYYHAPYDRASRTLVLREVRAFWQEFMRGCYQLGIVAAITKDPNSREAKIDAMRRSNELKNDVMKVYQSRDLDEYREHAIRATEYFGIQCAKDLRFVEEEMQILATDPEARKTQEKSAGPVQKPWSVKLDKSNIRTLMSSQVFRPDIAMPTMSLEEFAQLEIADLMANSAGKDSTNQQTDDECDDFYMEQRIHEAKANAKARAWDDWKDDNPRGSGNKMVNLG